MFVPLHPLDRGAAAVAHMPVSQLRRQLDEALDALRAQEGFASGDPGDTARARVRDARRRVVIAELAVRQAELMHEVR